MVIIPRFCTLMLSTTPTSQLLAFSQKIITSTGFACASEQATSLEILHGLSLESWLYPSSGLGSNSTPCPALHYYLSLDLSVTFIKRSLTSFSSFARDLGEDGERSKKWESIREGLYSSSEVI